MKKRPQIANSILIKKNNVEVIHDIECKTHSNKYWCKTNFQTNGIGEKTQKFTHKAIAT